MNNVTKIRVPTLQFNKVNKYKRPLYLCTFPLLLPSCKYFNTSSWTASPSIEVAALLNLVPMPTFYTFMIIFMYPKQDIVMLLNGMFVKSYHLGFSVLSFHSVL